MDAKKMKVLHGFLSTCLTQFSGDLMATMKEFRTMRIDVTDPEEKAAMEFIAQMQVNMAQYQGSYIRKIEVAIQKIEQGTYGICEMCESTIKPNRLKADPFVSTCIECQAKLEVRQKDSTSALGPMINLEFIETDEGENSKLRKKPTPIPTSSDGSRSNRRFPSRQRT